MALLLDLAVAASWAAPRSHKIRANLKNIELCNGADRSSAEPQIKGCTALIDSGKETTLVLAIAHTNRGNAYAARGDYDLAISDYDLQRSNFNPEFSKPFNNRGVAFLKKGNYDRAIKDFDEAIRLTPITPGLLPIAPKRTSDGTTSEAGATTTMRFVLRRIWKPCGTDAAGPGRSWTIAAGARRLQQGTLIQPNDAATLDSRGLIYLKMGQFNSAIQDYNSALRIEPKMASALYGRGLARL